ncbi:CotH kinase family protein [Clostridioides sp. ZZV14-6009]|uniref:CotH kinase family protein n=1 Tax=unclassified Clostridioides TaxID=2635829 RepID=UPI001D12FDF3|nr:CotH kinase family protein [Clostridioides sp. ZZV14-6153]MCC0728017.1 CotH kinase family protein [Clostridioides sp. ZZV14-6045]MCC0732487.1 CotH kinase family protein [Clostridioides sp. ZZV14-6048]MCC0736279.1 CotH kinase family protein [Clostridioides sp. ZZV14-6009]
MKDKKLTLLISFMVVFLCAIVGIYSISGNKGVDLYSDAYIEKYFDRDKVMEINIEIDDSDLKDMNENAIKEEFKVAKVTVDGDAYGNVGIRTKGNSSLTSVANSDSDRYSYKINFDKYNTSKSMEGLTQLNLNNCYSDPSYMREFITYSICEDMGLATPEFAYAKVSINGEYHGLYLAVEGLKESYLENNFGDVTGDLYKSDEGASLQYNGDDSESYSNLIVESDKKTADWSKVTKLLKSLDTGEDIEKYLDVDSVLKNIAINTALLNLDSYQGNFAHNYYLYEQDGVFSMLPWDFNMSFGGFGGTGKSGDGQSIYIDEPTTSNLEDRPLISALLKNETYKTKYHEYLEEIVTKYLGSDYLENMTTKVHDLIVSYVKEDPTAFYTYEEFEKNITSSIESSNDDKGGNKGFGNQEFNNKDSNDENNENKSDEKEVNAELTLSETKNNADSQAVDNNEDKNNTNNKDSTNNNESDDKSKENLESPMGKGGKSIPGVLEVAESMSKTIKAQLSGESSSTKETSDSENSSDNKDMKEADEGMNGMPEPPEGMDGNTPPGMGNMDKGDTNNKQNGNMKMDRNQGSPKEAGNFGGKGGGSMSKTTACSKLVLGGTSMLVMSVMLVCISKINRRKFIKSK